MKARAILIEMTKKKTMFGCVAKLYLADDERGALLLQECHEQIISVPKLAEHVFGASVVAKIKVFCNNEPHRQKLSVRRMGAMKIR